MQIYFTEKEVLALTSTASEWTQMMCDGDEESMTAAEERLDNGLGSALYKLYKGRNAQRIYESYVKSKKKIEIKYYEVLFTDTYAVYIKSEIKNPTREQVAAFLKDDMNKYHYKLADIESINEISLEEASNFCDYLEDETLPILK